MGTAQNNSDLKNLYAVELDLCNKDMMADTFDHSIIAVGEEEEEGNFQRSLPTRESLRSPRGSVVSFHNIQYSVKQSSGFLCKRKTVEKKILHNVYILFTLHLYHELHVNSPPFGNNSFLLPVAL